MSTYVIITVEHVFGGCPENVPPSRARGMQINAAASGCRIKPGHAKEVAVTDIWKASAEVAEKCPWATSHSSLEAWAARTAADSFQIAISLLLRTNGKRVGACTQRLELTVKDASYTHNVLILLYTDYCLSIYYLCCFHLSWNRNYKRSVGRQRWKDWMII